MRERVPERYNDQLCNIRYSMAFKPKLHELPKKVKKIVASKSKQSLLFHITDTDDHRKRNTLRTVTGQRHLFVKEPALTATLAVTAL